MSGQIHTLAALVLEKNPGTQWIGDFVGLQIPS